MIYQVNASRTKGMMIKMKVEHKLDNLVLRKADGSTYLLLIYVDNREHLLIGKLGWVNFPQGYYTYIGSAKRSIRKRLLRHLRGQKNKFWHIDYLLSSLPRAKVINIWTNKEPCECTISQRILQSRIGMAIKEGFGSSDCRCLTHLFKIKTANLSLFNQLMVKEDFYPLLEIESYT